MIRELREDWNGCTYSMVSSAVKRTSWASSSRHMRLICGFNTLSICFRSWYGAVRIGERRRRGDAYLGIAPRQKFAYDAAAVLCMNHFCKHFLASGHIVNIGRVRTHGPPPLPVKDLSPQPLSLVFIQCLVHHRQVFPQGAMHNGMLDGAFIGIIESRLNQSPTTGEKTTCLRTLT